MTHIGRYSKLVQGIFAVVALAAAAACGAEPTTGGGSTSGSPNTGGSDPTEPSASSSSGSSPDTLARTSSFKCCLNDVGYACPSEAAADKCAGTGGAPRTPPDPSACTPDENACRPSSSSSGGSSSGSACGGTGIACTLDLHCCDGLVCGPRHDGQEGGSCQKASE